MVDKSTPTTQANGGAAAADAGNQQSVHRLAQPIYNPRLHKTRSVTPNLFLLFDEKA